MAIKNNDLDITLPGKFKDDLDIILQGVESLSDSMNLILVGVDSTADDLDITLQGKTVDDQNIILSSKFQDELLMILNGEDSPDISAVYHFRKDEGDELEDFLITSGALVNEVTIKYSYDYAEGKFKSSITKANPLSKLLYRESKKTLELKMIQRTRQAEKIADAVLFTSSIPEIISSFRHNLKSLYVEVGDIVSITHSAGLGAGGFIKSLGTVIDKNIDVLKINYSVVMTPVGNLYKSELVNLSQVVAAGEPGITVQYEQGVATITIYADVQGYPPVEGAEVTITSVKKITDRKGQVRFNLDPGTYTVYITASGYEDAEITFTV